MWEPIRAFLKSVVAMLGADLLGKRSVEVWKDAAAACGLEVVEASSSWHRLLRARSELGDVRIETFGDEVLATRIVVEVSALPELHSVTIRPELKYQISPSALDNAIGDRHFDAMFFIAGPVQVVFALLDAETRRLLVDLKETSQPEIALGGLRAVVHGDHNVASVLSLLLSLGKHLAPPLDISRRLARNATQDPDPGVRRQNLLLLIHEHSGNPETREALRKACSDPIPEIRLQAAKQLGAEGHGVLQELAENLEDDAVSAEAFSIVHQELPFERVIAVLDLALSQRLLRTAYACLEKLGRSGAAAVDKLAQVLETEDGELAPMVAWALGATGSPAAEPPLLQALERDNSDVQVAVANALARVGSAAAVLPLKEKAERYVLDFNLRRAMRQAIAEIQSRAQGASPGQLSLAGTEAGQLSLATDPAGQLSLPPAEPEPLSLSDDNPDAAPGTAASPSP